MDTNLGLEALAERMHAEHVEDVPAVRLLRAENCGACQRWARYALAAVTRTEQV